MWYFNGQTIKTPKVMVISGITHPRQIFRDSDTLTSLGIKPYSQTTPDSRYYHNGAFTLDESGDEVVGTYAGTARDEYNMTVKRLNSNDNVVELTTDGNIDLLSNGFKARNTDGSVNSSGGTYIYMAFAETPFKYSNAR